MSLPQSILLFTLIPISLQSCADHYQPITSCNGVSAAALITDESSSFSCQYDAMADIGDPLAVDTCTLTCPTGSNMVAFLTDFNVQITINSAYFDSVIWLVTQEDSSRVSFGNSIQFGCETQTRCTPFIDDKGVEYTTKCNLVDSRAQCNDDILLPLCTCTAGYTGTTCGITLEAIANLKNIGDYDKLRALLEAARKTPALLVDNFPAILAFLPEALKRDLSWSLDEVVDSLIYELSGIDTPKAFTQIFDDTLGNCYTFNYANTTVNPKGLYQTRLAGHNRGLSIMLKLEPVEQVAWIECSAISVYIHGPGTPPKNGALYSLRSASSDTISLKKSITKLIAGCIVSKTDLKQSFYDDGEYTTNGCYSACYQDKIQSECGCMDARLKKAPGAIGCTFNKTDCIDSVTSRFGEPSTWPNCHCPPACYQEVFGIEATRTALPYKLASCSNDSGCDEINERTARLTLFMTTLESEVYNEYEKMTIWTFLSQFGGILGFILGMSVVGIIEILILFGQLGRDSFSTSKKKS
ncbi:hypothetical protein PRIPAC_82310 [Pristionchus pacificus]|nr:hypothetical protein PRIPAC_82310 [Pristionchus pacificus]